MKNLLKVLGSLMVVSTAAVNLTGCKPKVKSNPANQTNVLVNTQDPEQTLDQRIISEINSIQNLDCAVQARTSVSDLSREVIDKIILKLESNGSELVNNFKEKVKAEEFKIYNLKMSNIVLKEQYLKTPRNENVVITFYYSLNGVAGNNNFNLKIVFNKNDANVVEAINQMTENFKINITIGSDETQIKKSIKQRIIKEMSSQPDKIKQFFNANNFEINNVESENPKQMLNFTAPSETKVIVTYSFNSFVNNAKFKVTLEVPNITSQEIVDKITEIHEKFNSDDPRSVYCDNLENKEEVKEKTIEAIRTSIKESLNNLEEEQIKKDLYIKTFNDGTLYYCDDSASFTKKHLNEENKEIKDTGFMAFWTKSGQEKPIESFSPTKARPNYEIKAKLRFNEIEFELTYIFEYFKNGKDKKIVEAITPIFKKIPVKLNHEVIKKGDKEQLKQIIKNYVAYELKQVKKGTETRLTEQNIKILERLNKNHFEIQEITNFDQLDFTNGWEEYKEINFTFNYNTFENAEGTIIVSCPLTAE